MGEWLWSAEVLGTIPAVMTVAVGLFLCATAVHKGRWRLETLLFCGVSLFWSLNAIFFILHGLLPEVPPLVLERLHHALYVWVPFVHLSFFYRWLDMKNPKLLKACFWGCLAFCVAVASPLYIRGVNSYSWGVTASVGPLFFVELVYAIWVAVHLVRLCLGRIALAGSPEERRALSCVTWACISAAVLAVLNVPSFLGFSIYTPGNFAGVPLMGLAYAVLRYRVLDIRTLLHQSLVWAAFSSLILVPNILVIFWIRPYIEVLNDPILFLFFSCVFYLNYRYSRYAQPFIDRLFNRQRFDLKRVETHFTENILLLRRTEEMVEEFRRTVEATLRIRGLLFFTRKGEGFMEERSGRALELSAETLHWLSLLQAPLDRHEVERRARQKSVRREVTSLLERCGCSYILSLSRYGELLGLVLLPEKSDYSAITPREERFISRIKAFVSIALYNSTVYQNLSGLKEELARHTDALTQEAAHRKEAQEIAEVSERRYRLLADNVMDTIAVVEADPLVFRYLSPSVHKHLGYTESELLGRRARTVMTPAGEIEAKALLKSSLNRSRAEGPRGVIFEVELVRKDGSLIWSEISARFLWGKNGKPTEVLLVARDVTERKGLEKERETLQRKLRQAQKMESIGVLAGSIAHDFNNILMAMMGYTQLAMMHISEENTQAREKIALIDKAGLRARDLVAQILAFSRQNEQKSEPCYLRELVKDTVGFLGASLPSNIEIKFQAGRGSLRVVADPVQVHQIIINLATNAFHAIGDEGGSIGIHLDEVDVREEMALELHVPEGPYVCIAVVDSGHGVDPEIASRIFEPYYTTKEVGKGTGMGLAVVHGIVLNHGGAVHLESQRGMGATFRVYLPAGDFSSPAPGLGQGSTDENGSLGRVLLVDGEEIFIDLAREVLTRLGYTVEACTDADKALALLFNDAMAFTAAVTELHPGGIELAQKAASMNPPLPVVVTSTHTVDEMREALGDQAVGGMLTKPFTLKDLSDALEGIVGRSKS